MGEEVRTDLDEESCIVGLKETKDGDEVVVMADKATERELRRLYEETMFQQFISMEKSELSELLWHG